MVCLSPHRYRRYRHCAGAVAIVDETCHPQRLLDIHEHLVLVRPSFTGICSADVREVRGERPGRCDFGHEVVGTVLESTHDQYPRGTCVVLNPFQKIERETGFAQLMYLAGSRETLSGALITTPDDRAAFAAAEPLACVIHAARNAQESRTGPVLVLGAGFFGYLLYRYLEITDHRVRLANRTPDRLDYLQERAPHIAVVRDLPKIAGECATVFLMQTSLTRRDIEAAVPLLRDGGELVLFGAIDPNEDESLKTIRRGQQRTVCEDEGKRYALQGTLDATRDDLNEALALLSLTQFVSSIDATFAPPLTFERGASHLNERAKCPRTFEKHLVSVGRRESHARYDPWRSS